MGSFHVTQDDRPTLNFVSNKVRTLLAYLVVESEQAYRREKLAALFWPEMASKLANSNLNQAIYNLQQVVLDHQANPPRGQLFRRLIEFGPPHPDDPEVQTSNGETTLSDPECGKCVQFIFYHMVNRFKGELAELLSIEPCCELVNQLITEGRLPDGQDEVASNTNFD